LIQLPVSVVSYYFEFGVPRLNNKTIKLGKVGQIGIALLHSNCQIGYCKRCFVNLNSMINRYTYTKNDFEQCQPIISFRQFYDIMLIVKSKYFENAIAYSKIHNI